MFGFLKQKIADFGNKLKETIKKEEVKEGKTEEVVEKKEVIKPVEKKEVKVEVKKETKIEEKTKVETKTIPKKEEVKKTLEVKTEEKAKTEIKKPEPKKEEPKKVEEKTTTKPTEEKKVEETKSVQKETPKVAEPEKKVGILGKLFGFGKKQEEKKETPKTEKKGKTKEELVSELEAKMFAEIDAELKTQKTVEEEIEETEEEKETPKAEEKTTTKLVEEKKQEETKQVQKETPKTKEVEKKELDEIEKEFIEEEETEAEVTEEVIVEEKEKPRDIKIKSVDEDKRELKANLGMVGGIKGFLFGGVEITEKEIADLLWELELSLIESDVEQEAASELVKQIKQRLVGSKVSTKNIDQYLQEQIKEILTEMMKTDKINVLELAKQAKKEGRPLKILVIGPNGAGKTTSIAKLVHYFQKNKLTSIVAAGDTFRAGAIDQIEEHAKRLGVRVIKQQYGADPSAVAFDAIKAAEAGKLDVVLIDSAGRQETNKNLMEELRKLERVAKPDLKIYVGEAYVGQTLLEQVNEFSEIIGIDGFILTKIDTDAKGGTAISLLYKTKKPIIFVGTGQGYDDFKEFTPEFILERII